MYFEESLEGIFNLRMYDDSKKILTKSSTPSVLGIEVRCLLYIENIPKSIACCSGLKPWMGDNGE